MNADSARLSREAACFRFCIGRHVPSVSSQTGHTGSVCETAGIGGRGEEGGVAQGDTLEAQEQCTVVQRPVQVLHSRGYTRAAPPKLKQVMAESFSRAFQRKNIRFVADSSGSYSQHGCI